MIGKERSKLCFCLCIALWCQCLTNFWNACTVGHSPKGALILFRDFSLSLCCWKCVFFSHHLSRSNQSQVKVSFSIHPEKVNRPCKIICFRFSFCSHLYSRKYCCLNSWLIFLLKLVWKNYFTLLGQNGFDRWQHFAVALGSWWQNDPSITKVNTIVLDF